MKLSSFVDPLRSYRVPISQKNMDAVADFWIFSMRSPLLNVPLNLCKLREAFDFWAHGVLCSFIPAPDRQSGDRNVIIEDR